MTSILLRVKLWRIIFLLLFFYQQVIFQLSLLKNLYLSILIHVMSDVRVTVKFLSFFSFMCKNK